MNEIITVEKSINRFWICVYYPMLLALLGIPFASIYIGAYFFDNIIGWIILIGVIIGIIVTYFYWTIGVYEWYVWAYYSVDSVYELDKAIDICNILDGGDWKEKLSKKNPEKYNAIIQRLNEPYRFEDDYSIPTESTIRYSIVLSIVYLAFCCCGLLLGILSLIYGHTNQGIVFIVVALGFTIWQLTNSLNRKPKITLNSEGITTISLGFNKWADISEEQVILVSGSKSKWYYLTYKTTNGDERIKINNLATSPARLTHLLIVYRNRNKENSPRQR